MCAEVTWVSCRGETVMASGRIAAGWSHSGRAASPYCVMATNNNVDNSVISTYIYLSRHMRPDDKDCCKQWHGMQHHYIYNYDLELELEEVYLDDICKCYVTSDCSIEV